MRSLFATLLLLFADAPAAEENPLSVALISETKSIAPGETLTLGVHLKPPAGFHTYWKHPGIVGLATSIEWSLPPDFSVGEIQWPAPQAVKMARYTAQGYRDETLLIIPITPPKELHDARVTLTAHASWMCCGDKCHPASKIPLSITLPVASSADPNPDTTPLFDRFREKVPKKDEAWSVEVARQPKSILLTLTSKQPKLTRDVAQLGTLRFFTLDGQVNSDREQKVNLGPGQQIRIELPISEEAPEDAIGFKGVITAEKSWREDSTSTALELP